jgi:hypothetical protein
MCEPTHSIIQFSLYDALGNSNANSLHFAMRSNFGVALANGIQDKKFLTYSMMGYGHSEGIKVASMPELLPLNAKYEALWWNRKVVVDTPAADWTGETKELAIAAARKYAERYSIGSLNSLRNFLAESLEYTLNPLQYIDAARAMFSSRGIHVMDEMIRDIQKERNLKKMLSHVKSVNSSIKTSLKTGTMENVSAERRPLVVMMNELTQHRDYFNSEWADDYSLWK